MHTHRSPVPPPAWGTPEHTAQRLLLRELVADPPAGGEPLAALARDLALSARAAARAADALVAAGLVRRHAGRVRASPAALYVEALWPLGR